MAEGMIMTVMMVMLIMVMVVIVDVLFSRVGSAKDNKVPSAHVSRSKFSLPPLKSKPKGQSSSPPNPYSPSESITCLNVQQQIIVNDVMICLCWMWRRMLNGLSSLMLRRVVRSRWSLVWVGSTLNLSSLLSDPTLTSQTAGQKPTCSKWRS